MARRNSYMPPNPESPPFNLSNPPNPNHQWQFERTMLPNPIVRLPNPHPANSEAFHGQYHHPPSAASSSQSSTYSTQYAPRRYDQRAYMHCPNMVYPREQNVRVAFKRKHPAYQNDHGYYPTGRSDLQLKPVPGCCWPRSSAGTATIYPSDNFVSLSAGEQQHRRNVRSRLGDASFSPSWRSSGHPSHQLYAPANNFSSNVVGRWDLPPPPATPAQLVHPTGAVFSNFMMNRSVAGNGASSSDQRRNQYSVLPPTSHEFTARATMAGPSRYNHRQISASFYKDYVPPATGSVAFHRNPRPIIRGGGLRISNEAQPLYDEENELVRWASQGSAMIDAPSFLSPLHLLDEYRDLRLDIDNMSYEDLLALGDRIGSVHTGLSEDQLSSCLTKSTYCSSLAQDQFESGCIICLEEFKDEENIGMMKCHHAYHVSCINDWLRIKNACPICKSPAL